MAVAPDSRYYVHASTHAAKAQMEYLKDFANERPARPSQTTREGTRRDLRRAWWIALTIIVVLLGVAVWAFSR
jgi:uncharacterized protein involved in exopolysaccharide biosynthesis